MLHGIKHFPKETERRGLCALMLNCVVGCTGEAYGKAGAYGIQGAASVFVKELHGDYFNVMGFPLHNFATHISDLVKQKAL